MPQPETNTAGGLCATGRVAAGEGANHAADLAWLVCRHRVPGSAAGCGRALPSHVAPHANPPGASLTRSAGRRYVDYAIRDLARQFDALGAQRNEVEVKLFGGGDVLEMASSAKRPTVGRLNSEAAMKVLAEEGFGVAASSLGGKRGVNIHFNTETGEVFLQRHS